MSMLNTISVKRILLPALVSFSMTVSLAGPAFADGLHIFNNDPNTVWHGGCTVTYSMDDRSAGEYAPYITKALAEVAPFLGFSFQQVGNNDPSANLRYSVSDVLPGGAAGWGSTDGSVQLAPISSIPDWQDPVTNDNIREGLVIHESLHVFGLDHDMDEGSPVPDEIMYPILPTGPIHFGNGDTTGMTYIRDLNGCGGQPPTAAPAPTTPGPITVVIPTNNPTAKPFKKSAKQRCLAKPDKRWNAKTHKCVPRKAR